MAYSDSDKLDDELRQEGIEMISPHRRNRKESKDSGWSQAATLRVVLAGGEVLCLDTAATLSPCSMEILRREFSWL
jgi:hypothetical protein